jgi:hypothetical protein
MSNTFHTSTHTIEIITQIQQYKNEIMSSDQVVQLESIQGIRKLLSIELNKPIQLVIDAGIVPLLMPFLQNEKNPKLRYEAVFILTSITSGTSDQIGIVINNGAIAIFIQLLKSSNEDICEQSDEIADDSIHILGET